MLIASFGPATGWAGKTITYENGQFAVQDYGVVSAQAVLDYDRQGHLEWAYDGLKEWVGQAASQPTTAPPSAAPVVQTRKRSVFWPVLGALVVFFVVIPVIGFIGCAACGTAAVVTTQSTPKATPAPSPAAAPAMWVKVVRLSGHSSAKSAPFTLKGGEQRIVISGPNPHGGPPADVTVTPTSASSDYSSDVEVPMKGGASTSHEYLGAGRYYLDVGCFGTSFKCTLWEKR